MEFTKDELRLMRREFSYTLDEAKREQKREGTSYAEDNRYIQKLTDLLQKIDNLIQKG